jgi:hypothetical protein
VEENSISLVRVRLDTFYFTKKHLPFVKKVELLNFAQFLEILKNVSRERKERKELFLKKHLIFIFKSLE